MRIGTKIEMRALSCLVAAFYITTLTSCDTAPDAGCADGCEAASKLDLHAYGTVDGADVSVAVTLADDGKTLVGSRLARAADGTVNEENIALPIEASGTQIHNESMSRIEVPGAPETYFDVTGVETRGDVTTYRLTSSFGQQITVDARGTADYVVIQAIALILSIGAIALIITCGYLTYTTIRTCANQNKCWSYSISRAICRGVCQSC